jgi:hypothetical protein
MVYGSATTAQAADDADILRRMGEREVAAGLIARYEIHPERKLIDALVSLPGTPLTPDAESSFAAHIGRTICSDVTRNNLFYANWAVRVFARDRELPGHAKSSLSTG